MMAHESDGYNNIVQFNKQQVREKKRIVTKDEKEAGSSRGMERVRPLEPNRSV
jgi:hypothetical protein